MDIPAKNNPDGSDERQLASGPNSGFGIASSLNWIGSTGDLMTNERVSFHEYMRFNLSQTTSVPVARVVSNGDDSFFSRTLLIDGGLGGDGIAVSPDGARAAWQIRVTPNPAVPGRQQLRTAPLADLTGQ